MSANASELRDEPLVDVVPAPVSTAEGVTVAAEPMTAAAAAVAPISTAGMTVTAPMPAEAESLLVLSHDHALVESLRTSSMAHALVVVSDESDLASRLLEAHAGVAVIDSASVPGGIVSLVTRLREQFPDLILIVAGNSTDQADLATQVTDGEVHRFLHKPVSAQRIKLFVEAAWRRHSEEHSAGYRATAHRAKTPQGPDKRSPLPIVLAVAAAVVIGGGLWFAYRPATTDPVIVPLAAKVVTPVPSQSATLERILNDAEKALLSGQLDNATALVDSARRIQVDSVRVVFLDAQIAKERERLLAQAKAAVAANSPGTSPGPAPVKAEARERPKPAVATHDATEQRPAEEPNKNSARAAESARSPAAELRNATNTVSRTDAEARTPAAPATDAVATAERAPAQQTQSPPAQLAQIPATVPLDSAATDTVPESSLKRLKYVAPKYPSGAARDGIGGWVDLEFELLASGRVVDVAVVASQPDKVFDVAAVDAVRAWKYEAVVRNGKPVDQRARVRIRFNIQ